MSIEAIEELELTFIEPEAETLCLGEPRQTVVYKRDLKKKEISIKKRRKQFNEDCFQFLTNIGRVPSYATFWVPVQADHEGNGKEFQEILA